MKPSQLHYQRVIVGHGLFSLGVLALLLSLNADASRAMSFGVGAAIVWANWWWLGWSWRSIEGKKPIALSGALIVIKYPLLAAVCFFCLRQPWLLPVWFVAGIITVIPAGFWALKKSSKQP